MKIIYNTFVYETQKCHKWGDIEVLLYSTSYRYAGLHNLEMCNQFEILYIFRNTISRLDNHFLLKYNITTAYLSSLSITILSSFSLYPIPN